MLILTRKRHESVAVGEAVGREPMVKVTVLEIGQGKVRLGFEAGREVAVYRWELWVQMQQEEPTVEGPG